VLILIKIKLTKTTDVTDQDSALILK
jgi:hypothetical protein